MRRIAAALVGVMLLVAGCSSGSPAARPSASPTGSTSAMVATNIVFVRPTLPHGTLKPGYRISRTVSGASCWNYDTFGVVRCDNFNGGGGDFCWRFVPVAPSKATEVCLVRPWGRDVVAATLARGEYRPIADQAPAGSPVETIALQLTDGRQCEVNYGALDSVGPPGFDSPTVTYTCGPLTYLVDQPDRKKELWTIESAKASKDYKYTLTGVVYIAQAYAVEPDL